MNNLNQRFEKLGINVPEILLPDASVDMTKWAAVACDQFSSEREYWEDVKQLVGPAPSTFKLILPECYLEEEDAMDRVKQIQIIMKQYVAEGILKPQAPGFIYIDRKTAHAPSRKGLIVGLDLETYEFKANATSLTRPTEGTVIERLPPRMDIRREAILDMPHIMLLVDDKEGLLLEKLAEQAESLETIYDFELMKKSGHIVGKAVNTPELLEQVVEALEHILGDKDLLFAVGDGNHSLAAAKGIWEERKAAGAPANDPARYALVEIENIYDSSLEFEPIHRVLFDVDRDDLLAKLNKTYCCSMETVADLGAMYVKMKEVSGHPVGWLDEKGYAVINVDKPEISLDAEVLQTFLDDYLKANSDVVIDYIHGDKALMELGSKPGNCGMALLGIEKDTFFTEIRSNGALPRKTFSMGEADEKRFYIEARDITPA